MGIVKEFKEFILKGNMIDMAVGIIIGAAFGLVVKSFVADIVMPPVGAAMGGIDFADLKHTLIDPLSPGVDAEGNALVHPVTQVAITKEIPAVTLNYGLFINACIALFIQGLAIFVMIKIINNMKRKAEEAPKEPAAPPKEEVLLTEIRDLLAKQNG